MTRLEAFLIWFVAITFIALIALAINGEYR